MSSVRRTDFRSSLEQGIDLGDAGLEDNLDGSGVTLDQVKKADLDGDGLIGGRRELDTLFKVVDGADHDHNANTFDASGAAGQVYGALIAARRDLGPAIQTAAAARVTSDGPDYAVTNAPTSPLEELSGNKHPGVTQPGWLKDQNKCNQFVGDVLTQADVKAPTVAMANGSKHYASAETWPSHSDLFDRITDQKDIQIGDVLVRDYPGAGESTAHVEVVTGLHPLKTTGAHSDGAYETENHFFDGATANPGNRSFTDSGGNDVYILRPKKSAD
jgi:hypothetical protein